MVIHRRWYGCLPKCAKQERVERTGWEAASAQRAAAVCLPVHHTGQHVPAGHEWWWQKTACREYTPKYMHAHPPFLQHREMSRKMVPIVLSVHAEVKSPAGTRPLPRTTCVRARAPRINQVPRYATLCYGTATTRKKYAMNMFRSPNEMRRHANRGTQPARPIQSSVPKPTSRRATRAHASGGWCARMLRQRGGAKVCYAARGEGSKRKVAVH